MKIPTLEEVIRNNIQISNIPSSKGFYPVLCKICHDHGRKGLRAGFKFNDDGSVGYNCFNCGHVAKYDPSSHISLSKNMIAVMNSFDIPESEYSAIYLNRLKHQKYEPIAIHKKSIEPKQIDIPKHFYRLVDSDENKLAITAREYLENRGININDYPFFLSRKGSHPNEIKWFGRLIIPIYKNNQLIFYQGRSLQNDQKKYINPDIERSKIIYGFDQLFKNINQPLYILEGFFDAFLLNGIAIFGNKMTPEQIEWINKSPRQKIVIPDRKGDGHLLAKQAITLNWSVATPDIGDCKDINEAVIHYGKLYVIKAITTQIHNEFAAEALTMLYCEK